MDDLISRNAALALVVKAIHGTDSEEIKDYLFGGLRKELWALPSAEPNLQPTCNQLATDVISRQEAIDALCKRCDLVNDDTCGEKCIDIKILEKLPPAEPERKKGEWINRSLNILYPEFERYTCSVCGKHSYSYDFCPHCGSYNGGGQSEVD